MERLRLRVAETGSLSGQATPYSACPAPGFRPSPAVIPRAADRNSAQLQGCSTVGTRTPEAVRIFRLAMRTRGSWRNGTPYTPSPNRVVSQVCAGMSRRSRSGNSPSRSARWPPYAKSARSSEASWMMSGASPPSKEVSSWSCTLSQLPWTYSTRTPGWAAFHSFTSSLLTATDSSCQASDWKRSVIRPPTEPSPDPSPGPEQPVSSSSPRARDAATHRSRPRISSSPPRRPCRP